MKKNESDINRASINKKLKNFLNEQARKKKLKPSEHIFEFLEELPELCENCRGDIFRWSDIPENKTEQERLKTFLVEKMNLSWIKDAHISSQEDNKKILISKGTQELQLFLDPELETIKFISKVKINDPKLVPRQEKGKFNVYRFEHEFSLDPNLPIDRIFREPLNSQENFYHLYFIVSMKNIPESLEMALLYFKFHISKMIPSKLFDIQVIVSEKTEILQENTMFFENNGIGLIRIPSDSNPIKTIIKPFSYKEIFEKKLKQKKGNESVRVCEELVDNAIKSVVGVKPEKFGKSYIDRNLMNKMFDLERISFKDDLTRFISEHLTEKSDEYEFANEVFTDLWPNYIGPNYTDFLKIFEPSLQYISAETRAKGDPIYRDHYLHQFQVFLLGLPIIDKFYDRLKTDTLPNPELSWLIATSFHDIAYPVQKFDYWSENFFKDVFKLDRTPSILELKTNFIDEKFLACMGYLISELCPKHLNHPISPHWADCEDDYVQFFYRKITDEKNHGVMSSISLLKIIQSETNKKKIEKAMGKKYETALKQVILPSALAIALHDDKVWNAELFDLKKQKNKKNQQRNFLKNLEFDKDPLSFLLIFCDSVQEWGRPSKSEESAKENFGMKFYLKNFDCTQDKVDIKLWTPDCIKNHGFFSRKDKELKKVENFLTQPGNEKKDKKTSKKEEKILDRKISFIVRLEDRDEDESNPYIMKGPSN
jgi:hypothetical protein